MMAHFFLFYALGVCMGPFLAKLKEDAGSWRVAIAALAIFILSVAAALRGDNGYWDTALFSAAISGTALALFAATRLGGAAAQIMEYLGQRAMAIYVLHVLFVAGSRIIITRTTGVSEPALLVPALTVIGIAGPLAVTVLTDRMGVSQKLGLGGAVQPQRRPVYG
jgi:hypothetical protein